MIFGQSLHAGDLRFIGILIILEGLLSADNAMVLAIMVRHLPDKLQRRALTYGLAGAFVMRTLMILAASFIVSLWPLQLLGALYLVWLTINHFIRHASNKPLNPKTHGFWGTVLRVEIMDAAFALDSVLAGVAVVNIARHPDKTWVVVLGGVLGVVLLRFAAGQFIRILHRYPVFDHVAYLLVGWAGVKMVFATGFTFDKWWEKTYPKQAPPFVVHEMPDMIFWIGMLLIAGVGVFIAWKQGPQPISEDAQDEAEDTEELMRGQWEDPNPHKQTAETEQTKE